MPNSVPATEATSSTPRCPESWGEQLTLTLDSDSRTPRSWSGSADGPCRRPPRPSGELAAPYVSSLHCFLATTLEVSRLV